MGGKETGVGFGEEIEVALLKRHIGFGALHVAAAEVGDFKLVASPLGGVFVEAEGIVGKVAVAGDESVESFAVRIKDKGDLVAFTRGECFTLNSYELPHLLFVGGDEFGRGCGRLVGDAG